MTASTVLRLFGFGVVLSTAPTVHADDKSLQNSAYQASVEQEQIRVQTQRLVTDMNRMLVEFRNNPAAKDEVALTEATIQKLQSLSDKDMADVVAALREAGSPTSSATPDKILSANKTAREIQSTMVKLADKLALFQDEASVDLRLDSLLRRQLANQRQINYIQNGVVAPDQVEREATLATTEQNALKDEMDSLVQSLKGLAAHQDSGGQSQLGAVYAAALSAQIAPSSDAAQASTAAKTYPAALEAQGKVVKALQTMLLALNGGKSMEERLRTAESQMRSLTAKEAALAHVTISTAETLMIARRQDDIADQRTILELEVAQLSADTAPLNDQARQGLDNLDLTMHKDRGTLGNPDKKLDVINRQNAVAGQFRQIAEMLKKKADAVASASGSYGGGADSSSESMADAASSINDAISKMDMAQSLLNQGGDTGAAQSQINQAAGAIADATKKLGGAGASAPQGAGKELDQAKDNLGKGGQEASPSSGGPNRQAASASVGQAQDAAHRALNQLREAMDASSANVGQMMATGQSNPNQQGNDTGSGAGWGGLFHQKNQSSTFDAIAKISQKDPDALPALQREKAPSEYDGMAQQYMKNLAQGSVPNP